MTQFKISLRGYDRVAVGALVGAVEAAAGDRERIDEAITRHGALPVVLRGYDRKQVDAWLVRCHAVGPETGQAS